MSTPNAPTRVEVDKSVTWCGICGTSQVDDPDWAALHNAETGHPTARRTWTVESWAGAV